MFFSSLSRGWEAGEGRERQITKHDNYPPNNVYLSRSQEISSDQEDWLTYKIRITNNKRG